MNKKKIYKIIFVIVIALIVFFAYTSKIYATQETMQGAKNFLEKGDVGSMLNTDKIKQTSDTIYMMFSGVGTAIVLVVGVVLGIQFLMGSAEEKAKVKETLIPYGVGAVIVFGAVGIWTLVIKVMEGIF